MSRKRWLVYLKRGLTYFAPVVFIFFAASYLRQASDQTSRDDVFNLLREFPFASILLSVVATFISFVLLSASEILGFRSAKTNLSWRRIAKVSFISFGVSNVLSLGGLASTSLRFRLYLKDKISPANILKVTAFSSAGVWIGFFVLLGLCIFIKPITLPETFHIAPWEVLLIGGLSLAGVLAYVLLSWAQKPVIRVFGQTLTFPTWRFSLGQIGLAMLDWVIASVALYALLPDIAGVDFYRFLYVFLIAQVIGALTTIPGGLGILEILTVYLLLPNREITPDVAAALVLYRFIYYVIPLVVALVMLAVEEVVESTNLAAVVFRGLLRMSSNWVPLAGGFSTLIVAWSLVSRSPHFSVFATRAVASQSMFSTSNFALSLYAFFVVVLVDGVRRRSFSAWALTLVSVFITTVLLILIHSSWIAVGFAIAVSALLIFARNEFFRRSRLTDDLFSIPWCALSVLVIGGLGWLVFAISQDGTLGEHAWWTFLISGANPWLSATVMPITGLTGLSLWRLIVPNGRPSRRMPHMPFSLNQAAPIAMKSPVTQSQLVLLGDKDLFSSRQRDGFIMYAVEGRSWVALGDPVAPSTSQKSLIGDFFNFVDRQGGLPVFYQVQPAQLSQYVDFGYQLLKIGEEARVFLPHFTLEGRDRKSLRNTCNRLEKEEVTFEILPREKVGEHWAKLEAISNSWLSKGGIKEKGFSLGYFDREYLGYFDMAVLRKNGEIISFANLWKSEDKGELSIDLMRSSEESPSGSMEFLFIQLMQWGREQGYQWFNLGMAPLSGLEQGSAVSRTWNQLGSIIYEAGETFYNFKGVRAFKDKFSPVWEPRYLAYPNAFALPTVLSDVARLIGRGSRKGRKQ